MKSEESIKIKLPRKRISSRWSSKFWGLLRKCDAHGSGIQAMATVILVTVTIYYAFLTQSIMKANKTIAETSLRMATAAEKSTRIAEESLATAKREFAMKNRPYITGGLDSTAMPQRAEDLLQVRPVIFAYMLRNVSNDFPAYHVKKHCRGIADGSVIYDSAPKTETTIHAKAESKYVCEIPMEKYKTILHGRDVNKSGISIKISYSGDQNRQGTTYVFEEIDRPRMDSSGIISYQSDKRGN